VDDCIRNYYDLPGAKTDAEMATEHATASQEGVKPSSGRKSRRKEEKPTQGTTDVQERTREQVQTDNQKKLDDYVEAQQKAVEEIAGDREEVPYEEVSEALDNVPAPEYEKVPRRTRRNRDAGTGAIVGATPEELKAEEAALTEDTYFHIPETDNYVMKHAGDFAPEGGQIITEQEYKDAVVKIAKGTDQADGSMNPPETRTRRRRTRG
jgi:hypothetical protein